MDIANDLNLIMGAVRGDGLAPHLSPLRGGLLTSVLSRKFVDLLECHSGRVGSARESRKTYYFLKTIIPSRKATRDYLGTGESDEEA
jgi:hypothetical protein